MPKHVKASEQRFVDCIITSGKCVGWFGWLVGWFLQIYGINFKESWPGDVSQPRIDPLFTFGADLEYSLIQIKGDCWALVEVCSIQSAILVSQIKKGY